MKKNILVLITLTVSSFAFGVNPSLPARTQTPQEQINAARQNAAATQNNPTEILKLQQDQENQQYQLDLKNQQEMEALEKVVRENTTGS